MTTENLSRFTIDSNNVKTIYKTQYNSVIKNLLKKSTLVHKIIIQNTAQPSSKLNILKAASLQVRPHSFIAMEIVVEKNTIQFYCKNCPDVLEKFCEDNLLLEYGNLKLQMTLIIGCKCPKELNVKETLLSTLKNRISQNSPASLDLENFDRIPGIGKQIYCDITNPRVFNLILSKIKPFNPEVINLACNDLQNVRGFKFSGVLEVIDLSFNKISNLEDLDYLLKIGLKGIHLSDNPVCSQYFSKNQYIHQIRKHIPTIETIDLKPIDNIEFDSKDLYFISIERSEYLIDQFMDHYFTLFDNPEKRKYLQHTYHSNAIFSLSSTIVPEKMDLCPASKKFINNSHNLLQNFNNFVVGPNEIAAKICYLPETEHDPQSFSVDVLHYTENIKAVFTINGFFRESNSNPVVYNFSRTFVLIADVNGEFKVINDLLYVSNIPTTQRIKPFNRYYNLKFLPRYNGSSTAVTSDEKLGLLAIFIEITALHVEHAKMFLEKNEWNLETTLEDFVYAIRFDMLTENHFIHEEIKQIVFKQMPNLKRGVNFNKLGKLLDNLQELNTQGYLTKPKNVDTIQWRTRLKKIQYLLTQNKLFKINDDVNLL